MMIDGTQFMVEATGDEQVKIDERKGQLDLIILKYMARRLHLTFQRPVHKARSRLQGPVSYYMPERHRRTHRIVIYRQQELFQKRPLAFVGFISKRKRSLLPSIIEQIQQTDQKLVAELIKVPGIVSYSSLELPCGAWCNLVVLADLGAKKQIKGTETHAYAAYQLAHAYYEWIRLHTGTLSEGLDHMEMRLLNTRYYTFHAGQQRPSIQELEYGLQR